MPSMLRSIPVAVALGLLAACGTPTIDTLELDDLPSPMPRSTVPAPAPVAPIPLVSTAPGVPPDPGPIPRGTPATGRSPATPSAADAPAHTPAAAPPAGRQLSTLVTFYAAYDNDPPGSRAIAYPNARHREAGGVGTFDDPLTLASDPRELAVGTVVYYPALRKYFVMEDLCASCVVDWDDGEVPHIDLWTGPATDPGVTSCQEALTPDGRVSVELDPPADRPVDTTPLYTGGRCVTG